MEKKQYLNRNLFAYIKKWIDRKEILAIKGPRQAGKTTLLKMLEQWLTQEKKVNPDNIIFITFEDDEMLEQFTLDARETVKSIISDKKETFYLLIDEFHYLEQGGHILKLLYDTFDNIKFIITGSSSLELTGKTAKFLVGRVFFLDLWQFDFGEFLQVKSKQLNNVYQEKSKQIKAFIYDSKPFISPKKDIFTNNFEKLFEQYAIWGGYPEVLKTNDKETKRTILKNIYNTYIKKDIIELLKISNTSTFKKLINLLALRTGNLIKYDSLIDDSGSYFEEVKQYLSVLEETFIISLIKPFFTNKTTEIRKSPKIYFIDSGLRNYIINNFNIPSLRTDIGALAENIVFSQLKKQNDELELKYWRTKGDAEVDFIIEKPKELIPIEVKYSTLKSTRVSRSFKNFISQYKPQRGIILTKGFWGETKVATTLVKFIPIWYL
ncbi:ATP-binding protein [Patescibacteria group bacterium AH-259-L07]|nr:ATP-binding protein [Patescibacteria group bacterium AH-259-L07]